MCIPYAWEHDMQSRFMSCDDLPAQVSQRLLPILASLPFAVTLLDMEAGAVFQNSMSIKWVGSPVSI